MYDVSVSVSVHACVCLHSLTTTLSFPSFNLFVTLLLLFPPFLNPGWDDRKEMIRMAIFITNSYHYPELYPEWNLLLSSVQFSHSVVFHLLQSYELQHIRLPCPLPELTQTRNNDDIQPSHPLSSPSPSINLFQHQSHFKWVSSPHQVAKVLEFQLQHQSFQWNIQDWFPLGLIGLTALQSKGLSRLFSNTTVLKHQLFNAQLSLWSNSHIHTWLLEKT